MNNRDAAKLNAELHAAERGEDAPEATPLRQPQEAVERLLAVMAALRTPGTGCPWDLQQSFETIAPYTIEEAYEVADSIARGDLHGLKDELGDLLFNVVYHARLAQEAGQFAFHDVAAAAADKMIRRHPHVFAPEDDPLASAARRDLAAAWDAIKASERRGGEAREASDAASALSGISTALPAIARAQKILKCAQKAGFDWVVIETLIEKLDEEIAELKSELAHSRSRVPPHAGLSEELGDALFVLINLGLKFDIDAETALRRANLKFARRFQFVEQRLKDCGLSFSNATAAQIRQLWDEAKTATAEAGTKP